MKTWDDIKTVDDLISEPEKKIIKEIEGLLISRCPHLKKLGEFFYYCSGGVPDDAKLEFEPSNPIVNAKQDFHSLQLYCMSFYEVCYSYKGEMPFPGSV